MWLSTYALAMLPLLLRISGRPNPIPEVAPALDEVLYDLLNGTEYSQQPVGLVERDSGTPYWMETIPHQGRSAFGPAGYTVFRNVKEFGATGSCLILLNVMFRLLNTDVQLFDRQRSH